MGTTGGEVARRALAALVDARVEFGLLHEPGYLASDLSDLDTVVGEPPSDVIARCLAPWRASDLYPVVIWPYDIGGTLTVFLVDSLATEGVQLDLLYDPDGVGKYGVRSGRLLGHVDHDGDFPVVAEAARLVYLFQKRRVKRQHPRVEELMSRAREVPAPLLAAVAADLTGATELVEALRGTVPAMGRRRHPWLRTVRLGQRIVRPVGHWFDVPSGSLAGDLAARFGATLVVTGYGRRPGILAEPLWYALRVAPVRYRPGAFFSWGQGQSLLGASCPTVPDDPNEAARYLVERMERKVRLCVS